jgi:hypothetical protein
MLKEILRAWHRPVNLGPQLKMPVSVTFSLYLSQQPQLNHCKQWSLHALKGLHDGTIFVACITGLHRVEQTGENLGNASL